MSPHRRYSALALLLLSSWQQGADAFTTAVQKRSNVLSATTSTSLAAEGLGSTAAVEERPTKDDAATIDTNLTAEEAKKALIDLIPRMTGSEEEYRAVESYVNLLEEKYSPVQTIGFLNLAMAGEWQLLFSTNLTGRPNRKLRMTELIQRIEADGFGGKLINSAQWSYADNEEGTFDTNGSFNIKCSYNINQGARMVIDLDQHELRPANGSGIPSDVPAMVALLERAIPKEMFHPNDHAMDTTYLDADLRIARMTGAKYEGVRNIFFRKGQLEIKPGL
mmetsp:Transcript_16230/g.26556  ORF Transcript_16230/g.26556 Transcript_16230/m.26556 type:complete len:278 (+) Transcript_16230:78-911(+)